MHVDRTIVPVGGDVTGTVVFVNHRAVRVDLVPLPHGAVAGCRWERGCRTRRRVARLGRPHAPARSRARHHPRSRSVPSPVRRWPRARTPTLACPEPFPPGRAKVWFVTDGGVEHLAVPPPVAVEISGRGEGPPPQPAAVSRAQPRTVGGDGNVLRPAPTRRQRPRAQRRVHRTRDRPAVRRRGETRHVLHVHGARYLRRPHHLRRPPLGLGAHATEAGGRLLRVDAARHERATSGSSAPGAWSGSTPTPVSRRANRAAGARDDTHAPALRRRGWARRTRRSRDQPPRSNAGTPGGAGPRGSRRRPR